jgi:hypothetical protein
VTVGQITGTFPGVFRLHEGRFAIVTNVGWKMRWTHWAQTTNARNADGEVVWS